MSEANPDRSEARHPIKVVARRTGLTPDVLRVWEKRYGAVSPTRVDTGRRLYSDADVERLLLLRRATLAGRRIGQVAKMPNAELEALVVDDETAMAIAPRAADGPPTTARRPSPHLDACMEAALRLDAAALESAVWGAAVSLPTPALLDQVVTPLLHTLGEHWRVGTARITHEHLATAVTRSLLSRLRLSTEEGNGGPEIIVTTPAGQLHEMGALMAAITAASEGWRVTYLGPNLPAEEIAAATEQRKAAAVALSVIYPGDDPDLAEELRKLKALMPNGVSILVGGSGAAHCTGAIDEAGFRHLPNLASLRQQLESIRYKT